MVEVVDAVLFVAGATVLTVPLDADDIPVPAVAPVLDPVELVDAVLLVAGAVATVVASVAIGNTGAGAFNIAFILVIIALIASIFFDGNKSS
jgi:hypothetical protein